MNRDFKGIWIPKEIWLSDLSCQEKCLWSEIHSLYSCEKDGCYASNEYLCDFIGVKERRLQEMVANLKKHGWLIQVSFDGRVRTLKAVIPVVINVWQGCGKVHLADAEKCTSRVKKSAPGGTLSPYILERKDKRKEERKEPKAPTPTPPSKLVKQRAEHVFTADEEHEKLVKEYGLQFVEKCYVTLSEWKIQTPKAKWKKHDYLSIKKWVIEAVREKGLKSKNDSKALPGSKDNKPVPKDGLEEMIENKVLSEGIRGIVASSCNEKTSFQVKNSSCTLKYGPDGYEKEYLFGIPDFRKKIFSECVKVFPEVKEKIKELFEKYN